MDLRQNLKSQEKKDIMRRCHQLVTQYISNIHNTSHCNNSQMYFFMHNE